MALLPVATELGGAASGGTLKLRQKCHNLGVNPLYLTGSLIELETGLANLSKMYFPKGE